MRRTRRPPAAPRSSTPCRGPTPPGPSAGFEVYGKGFGATKGSGRLTLDGSVVNVATWSDTKITVTAGLSPSIGQGPHQLLVTAANGRTTVNGLTFHRVGGSYNPSIYEVGPTSNPNYTAAKATAGRWFTPAETLPATANHAIQNALNAAPAGALVVVYPNTPSANPRQNPRGAYYENLIISKRVKLQGVGPGEPGRRGPRVDHRWWRIRRRRSGRGRLVRPDRRPDVGRQPDRLRRCGHLVVPAEQRRQRVPVVLQREHRPHDRRVRPARRRPDGLPRQTSAPSAACRRASPAA